MDKNGNKIVLSLDVSTTTIGICILLDDGSDYGKIIELTHISPKVSSKVKGIESLFLKKRIFEEYIKSFKDLEIDEAVIEEPLLRSNNINTCGVLLRFNGMISDSIYEIFGVVPNYISSYDARKFSFPELMSVRKYDKQGKEYDYANILKKIKEAKLVLFGGMDWDISKKYVMQQKVSEIFPDIEWIYDKKRELKKQNFDAVDAYVAVLGHINKNKYGELNFKTKNINSTFDGETPKSIEYDIDYWGKTLHRVTYIGQ